MAIPGTPHAGLRDAVPPVGSTSFPIDLARFSATPLEARPFDFLVVERFVYPDALGAIERDFPAVPDAGSFNLDGLTTGPAFDRLVEALESDAFRQAIEAKFDLDLKDRPLVITVRGRARLKDGSIHVDSKDKLLSGLIYLNESWGAPGGALRLLNTPKIDDVAVEIPPIHGNLVVFRRSEDSWHGHLPCEGPRHVLQFNWLVSGERARFAKLRHDLSKQFKRLRRGIG